MGSGAPAGSDLVIVTGSSRGLGAELAAQLLAPDVRMLAIARSPNPSLQEAAGRAGAQLEQRALDLADAGSAAREVAAWLARQPPAAVRRATLVNNAAALAAPGPLELDSDEAIAAVVRVGLEAPVLLTAAFMRVTRSWAALRRVLLISSGAGRQPLAGSASYCAVKAGLDHFARSVALDQQAHGAQAVRIVSLAPGVFETGMQRRLREADPAVFPNRAYFVDLQRNGQLLAPRDAAARVLAYLNHDDFGARPVADVRDA